MINNKFTGSVALATLLEVKKVQRIGDECGVTLTLVDTHFRPDHEWVNDFQVEGSPGKIDAFLKKIKDVETKR